MVKNTGKTGKNTLPQLAFKQDEAFSVRLEEVIESFGSLAQAATAASANPQQVARWRDRTATPNFFGVANMCAAAGYSSDWLLTGRGPKLPGQAPGPDLLTAPSSEFALLPRYNVSASAGPGRIVAEEEGVIERLAFRYDWLREMGIDPKNAGLLTASGDSMSPTIPDGALMLVVRGEDEPVRSGYIYVIVLNGEVLVKRVSRNVDGSLDLISDNKIYPVQNVRQVDFERLFIAGRVFWIGFKL